MFLNYWLSTIHYAYAFIRIPCFSERCRSGFQPEADPSYGGNVAVSPDGWQAGAYGGKTVGLFGNNRRGAGVVYRGGLENRCAVRYPGFESRPLRHCRKAKMTEKTQIWFVYILRCSDASYYVGVATDLEDRVKEHNVGQGAAFTKKRIPVKLVYEEKHESYASARKREAQLKRWRREKKEWLINGFPSARPPDSLRT